MGCKMIWYVLITSSYIYKCTQIVTERGKREGEGGNSCNTWENKEIKAYSKVCLNGIYLWIQYIYMHISALKFHIFNKSSQTQHIQQCTVCLMYV